MPIYPLPQFEEDLKAQLAEKDRLTYEALQPPKSIVVRFGCMKMVGEFPYDGKVKPGCGSKVVIRTHRGTELGEMLTSTCPNNGCSKSVSRQEMLQYISNSGGRDYPFFQEGKVLRIATPEDLDRQAAIEQSKHALRLQAREIADRLKAPIKIVDIEPILGGELLTVFYASEERLELRDLYRELNHKLGGRVDLRHVGARDEARLTADYEKCGQYCCCKNFLKVLRPVSMKSAKVQKATLDPLKISGRCGRLMCCLRYEDETYEDLRKRLPRKKSRVGTPEGDGLVLDSQILTQLVLVELDGLGTDGKIRTVAVAVEDLTPPVSAVAPPRPEVVPGPPGRGPGGRGPQGSGPDRGPRDQRGPASEGKREGRPPMPGGEKPPARSEERRPERKPEGGRPEGGRPDAPRPGPGTPPPRIQRPERPREGGPRPGGGSPGGARPERGGERRPERGPDRGPAPERTPGPERGPEPARGGRPPADDVDSLMRSMEDDWGEEPRSGGQEGPDRGPGGGGRRRRRRRGRGPGGPSSGGGPGGSGPGGGGPSGGGAS